MFMEKLKFKEETYNILGAAMEVHRQLGCGFTEKFIKTLWKLNYNFEIFHINVRHGCKLDIKVTYSLPNLFQTSSVMIVLSWS